MDKYLNFSQLAMSEKEGRDYEIVVRRRKGAQFAVLAPHGGRIELKTDVIAKYIAGDEFSLYCFKGCKKNGNRDLHITSHNFDEPRCLRLIRQNNWIITVHGCKEGGEEVFLGGLDEQLIIDIANAITKVGLTAVMKGHNYPGKSRRNICNRGTSNMGVQFELTMPFRIGSKLPQFVDAVRGVLLACQATRNT